MILNVYNCNSLCLSDHTHMHLSERADQLLSLCFQLSDVTLYVRDHLFLLRVDRAQSQLALPELPSQICLLLRDFLGQRIALVLEARLHLHQNTTCCY